MSGSKVHISSILDSKKFCTLCMKNVSDNALDIDDEVCLDNDTDLCLLYSEIITNLLSKEFQQEICTITRKLCEKCAKSAVESYRFIKMCQDSRKTLIDTIDMLTDSVFDDSIDKEKYVKTVYIDTDIHNKKCTKYYDKYCKGHTIQKALQRFKKILQQNTKRKKMKKEKYFNNFLHLEDYNDNDTDINNDLTDNMMSQAKCMECFKEFGNKVKLNYHYSRVHAPKIYKCEQCSKGFSKTYHLKEHITQFHVSAVCAICGKTYKGYNGLKQHLFSHNMAKCNTCGRQYKSRHSYRKHVSSQICSKPEHLRRNTEKAFACDICEKRFSQKGSLVVHMKFEHGNGKSYTCQWCNRRFDSSSRLKTHIVKHTRERNFTCETCGGKFVSQAALVYHTRIHTGETPYKCHVCDMWFLSTSRRMDHMRRRHMDPTHECSVCGSKFKTKCALNKHKSRHDNPNSKLFVQNSQVETTIVVGARF